MTTQAIRADWIASQVSAGVHRDGFVLSDESRAAVVEVDRVAGGIHPDRLAAYNTWQALAGHPVRILVVVWMMRNVNHGLAPLPLPHAR
jgi:hypothetical protein